MIEFTVKDLAEKFQLSTAELVAEISALDMPQRDDADTLSQKEVADLAKRIREGSSQSKLRAAPNKITLNRTKTEKLSTVGRGRRVVTVNRRKRRTYVKSDEAQPESPVVQAEEKETGTKRRDESAVSELKREAARTRAEAEKRKDAHLQEVKEREALEEKRKFREEEQRLESEQKAANERAKRQAEQAIKDEEVKRVQQESAVVKRATDPSARTPEKAKPKRVEKDRRDQRGTDSENVEQRPRRTPKKRVSIRERRRRVRPTLEVEQGGEFEKPVAFVSREIELTESIMLGDLARKMSVKVAELIKKLMGMGVMATINQVLDQDTAVLIIEEMGHKAKIVSEDKVEHELQASLKIDGAEIERCPVVTVMGHVDHGKTSLLDYIRKTRVAAGEAGGITQHIGAYHLETSNGEITFLDTPGHAAFSAMRARGADATDIVVLVCAANDGVMPQTKEAVQHAQAANVPIIVAVNKMDLDGADPQRVRTELSALGITPDEWGGETLFVNVSAETGEGIDTLLEAISLQASLLELKAVPEASGRGVVIESKVERGRGTVATLLIQNGTLQHGDVVIAGEYFGKVRSLINDQGVKVPMAAPSIPVEMLGLNGTPGAGDEFSVVTDDRQARQIADLRAHREQQKQHAMQQATRLENMFEGMGKGEKRVLKIVLKADVRGSLEAISQACSDIGNDEVSVQILGSGIGGINESDVNMALTYQGVIFGFNVRADKSAKALVERNMIDVRYYNVIYELLDDIKLVLEEMLVPEQREEIVGTAEVRDVFNSPRYGQIAGCMVVEGTVYRNKKIRVLRDNTVIFEGELESLRRFKDDVQDVGNGFECGIGVRNYNDVRSGDMIEVYETREVARAL